MKIDKTGLIFKLVLMGLGAIAALVTSLESEHILKELVKEASKK